MDNNENLLNLKEAARRLTINHKTLRKWCQNKLIEHINFPDGRIRIPEKEVERIMTRTKKKEY